MADFQLIQLLDIVHFAPTSKTISGTVTVSGSGVRRMVFCMSVDCSMILGQTVSAADGTFSFTIGQNLPVLVVVPGEGNDTPSIHKVTPG